MKTLGTLLVLTCALAWSGRSAAAQSEVASAIPAAPAASLTTAKAPSSAAALKPGVLMAGMAEAPAVPAPVGKRKPAVVHVDLMTQEVEGTMMEGLGENTRYRYWTFNGHVPGPFMRVRVGDTLELSITNSANSTMAHNIDLHAVTGPGGGAAVTLVQPGETKTVRFKMLQPGLFNYHCAAPPVTDHIANGMYGLILVEPEGGLPKVDREYYVMQGEFYTKQEFGFEGLATYDANKAAEEEPTYVVFNGRNGSLLEDNALKAKTGETVRIFFGNGGPNKVSSFHVIGAIFDRVWREGSIGEPPARNVQTTLVPPGGSAIVDLTPRVPGAYTLVDHAIFRLQKGAVGALKVEGPQNPDIYPAIAAPKAE